MEILTTQSYIFVPVISSTGRRLLLGGDFYWGVEMGVGVIGGIDPNIRKWEGRFKSTNLQTSTGLARRMDP